MSIPKKTTVSCPSCKKQFETITFESLNTDFAPDVVETIISGERFNAKCPHCGFVAHLEYDFLYHDMKHNAMIWVIPKNSSKYSEKVDKVRALPSLFPGDLTRIVSSTNALREKVACLESGKDDRIIELYKVLLLSQVKQQVPGFTFQSAFYTYREGRDIVFFYDVNGKELACELDRDTYNRVSDYFKKPLSQLREDRFQVIDFNWAVDLFAHLPNG